MLRYLGRRLAYALALLLAVVTLNSADPHFAGRSGRDHRWLDGRHQRGTARPAARAIRAGQALHRAAGCTWAGVARRPPPFLFLQPAGDAADLGPRAGHAAAGRDPVLGAFLAGTQAGHAGRKPNGPLSQGITLLSIVGYRRRCSGPASRSSSCSRRCCRSSRCPTCARRARPSWAGPARWTCCITWCCRPARWASVYLAQYSRLARASVIEALSADYIRTARAAGLPERTVLYKHALRNGVLPVVTMLGLQFGNVLAGAILVETVFNWPGLGRLAFDSVLRRDYPTLLGILLFAPAGGGDEPAHRSGLSAGRSPDQDIMSQISPRRRAPYPPYPSRPFHPQPPWRRAAVATSGRAPVRQSREARAFAIHPPSSSACCRWPPCWR